MNIVFKTHCHLKKRPIPRKKLKNDEKAKVVQTRRMPRCEVIDERDDHTLFSTPFGEWWIRNADWEEEDTSEKILCQEVDGVRFLKDYPYLHQDTEGVKERRICQTKSIASALMYLGLGGIEKCSDYADVVHRYGHGAYRRHHRAAMEDIGVTATFSHTLGYDEIKDEIDEGKPVIAGLWSKGPYLKPRGLTYFVAIYGYDSKDWLIQDPLGKLNLLNGFWDDLTEGAGQEIRYDMELLDRRLFQGGGSGAMGWLNFREC